MRKIIGLMAIVFLALGIGANGVAAADGVVSHARYPSVAGIVARAHRGDIAAEAQLGILYLTGHDLPQNYYEAAKWLYRAAIRGHGGAQYALGMLYNKGEGVKRDYVLSYMWLNLSAAQAIGQDRDFKVRMRDAIASKMTPRQVQIAQQLALEWHKSR
jgi:uncharacterized protein